MSKCKWCGQGLGWFGGDECKRCEEEHKIKYGDRVEIINGFYKEQNGKVVEERVSEENFINEYHRVYYYQTYYTIKLDNGREIEVELDGIVKLINEE